MEVWVMNGDRSEPLQVAAYFALRAASAGYVYTAAFARRGKGLFDRPWINWLVRNLGRSARRQGSD